MFRSERCHVFGVGYGDVQFGWDRYVTRVLITPLSAPGEACNAYHDDCQENEEGPGDDDPGPDLEPIRVELLFERAPPRDLRGGPEHSVAFLPRFQFPS